MNQQGGDPLQETLAGCGLGLRKEAGDSDRQLASPIHPLPHLSSFLGLPEPSATNWGGGGGGLKRQKPSCLTVVEAMSSKSRCWQGHAPSATCGGESSLASSSFWWLSAVLSIPWLVEASLQSLLP